MIRTIFNRKGGVGKSTITCNLAAVSAARGKRTLVIDIDPQANSTNYLGQDGNDNVVGMPEFFDSQINYSFRDFSADDFVRPTAFDNLFLVSANQDLVDLESKLAARHKIYKLRSFLQTLAGLYDEIFIDTPPVLNFYSLSALIASDRCLIPFDCDVFSRDALFELLETIKEVKEDHNPQLIIEGVVINQFSAQAKLPTQAVAELQQADLPILAPYISSSVKIRESHRSQKPLAFFAPKHKVAQEFSQLFGCLCGENSAASSEPDAASVESAAETASA